MADKITQTEMIDYFNLTPNIAPLYAIENRGKHYKTAEDLISHKDDPKLRIPMFKTKFIGSSRPNEYIRNIIVEWMIDISKLWCFAIDRINVVCLAIELLDKSLLTLGKFQTNGLQILGASCMRLAAKMIIDNFVGDDTNKAIAEQAYTSIRMISITEDLIIKRLNWNISTRYSVPWFIDWLGGYKYKHLRKAIDDKILEVYLSGAYRDKDPYSVALNIMKDLMPQNL